MHWAAKVISIGALAGLTTVVIVLVLGQTRVLFAMCRDGLLPRRMAKTGPHGTPVRITVLVGVLVALAASVFPMGKLEEMVNIGTLFAFVLVSAGVIVLRRTRPDLQRGFRVPWVPLLPIAAILACLWLMLNLTGLTWIRFLSGWSSVSPSTGCTAAAIRCCAQRETAADRSRNRRSGVLQNIYLCLDSRQICLYSQVIKVMALTGRWTAVDRRNCRNSRSASGETRSGICG